MSAKTDEKILEILKKTMKGTIRPDQYSIGHHQEESICINGKMVSGLYRCLKEEQIIVSLSPITALKHAKFSCFMPFLENDGSQKGKNLQNGCGKKDWYNSERTGDRHVVI